eukprot:SAG22_NODE_1102_length_5560_cov_44.363120_2_plen_688_part_00
MRLDLDDVVVQLTGYADRGFINVLVTVPAAVLTNASGLCVNAEPLPSPMFQNGPLPFDIRVHPHDALLAPDDHWSKPGEVWTPTAEVQCNNETLHEAATERCAMAVDMQEDCITDVCASGDLSAAGPIIDASEARARAVNASVLWPVEANECESAPCQHNGHCVDLMLSYNCECVPGFTGLNCEETRERYPEQKPQQEPQPEPEPEPEPSLPPASMWSGSCENVADFAQAAAAVTAACCDESGETCENGLPSVCTEDCEAVLIPMRAACLPFVIESNLDEGNVKESLDVTVAECPSQRCDDVTGPMPACPVETVCIGNFDLSTGTWLQQPQWEAAGRHFDDICVCTHIRGNLTFGSDVDAGKRPTCLRVLDGDLIVESMHNIQTLRGFDQVQRVLGSVTVRHLPRLCSVHGLALLTDVGGDLVLADLPVLATIEGLGRLRAVNSSLKLQSLQILSATPLPSLMYVGRALTVSDLPHLGTLGGFEPLQDIGRGVQGCSRTIDGCRCDGSDWGLLHLADLPLVVDLSGFKSLERVGRLEVQRVPIQSIGLHALRRVEGVMVQPECRDDSDRSGWIIIIDPAFDDTYSSFTADLPSLAVDAHVSLQWGDGAPDVFSIRVQVDTSQPPPPSDGGADVHNSTDIDITTTQQVIWRHSSTCAPARPVTQLFSWLNLRYTASFGLKVAVCLDSR